MAARPSDQISGSREIDALAQIALAPAEALLPAERAAAARALADLVGVALAGSATAPARALAHLAAPASRDGGLVWGGGRRTTLRDAVLCNAFAAHALDFDDDETETAMAHLSVTAMTAAVTLAEASPQSISGRALLAAYVNGCNVALALGARVNPGLYRAGWHATSVLGVFAAAATATALLGAGPDETAHALGLAASLSGGIRGAFGGDGKPLQVAQAASSGVLAASLARAGHRSSPEALVSARGFLGMHGAQEPPEDWPGVAIGFPPPGFVTKLFPSCTATHAAVAALLDIMAESDTAAERIAAIHCRLDPFVPRILLEGTPRVPDEARFNLAYCLASAAVDRRLGPPAFAAEALGRPAVRALMSKVRVTPDTDLPKGPSGISTGAVVTVAWIDGSSASCRRDAAPGSRASPLTDVALREKFVLCTKPFFDAPRAETAFEDLLALADAEDVRAGLAAILSHGERS